MAGSHKKQRWIGPLLLGLCVLAIARVVWMGRAEEGPSITIYSGRSEDLVQPLLERFAEETGIRVEVRYGQTAEMAATILEEGAHSPADVFFAQDAGALGALAQADRLRALPTNLTTKVDERFRAPSARWVGVSGRARVVIYNPERVTEDELPDSLMALCRPEWAGRLGWAPANGSFQSFVTAMRVTQGNEATRNWLRCMDENGIQSYPKNTPIVAAVAAGEIDAGLVNHYYLHVMQSERSGTLAASNHYPSDGVLVNVAGVGILKTAEAPDEAERLVSFLLSEPAQRYFTDTTYEYPLAAGIEPNEALPSLDALRTPDLDLSDLADLDGTLRMLRDTGLL